MLLIPLVINISKCDVVKISNNLVPHNQTTTLQLILDKNILGAKSNFGTTVSSQNSCTDNLQRFDASNLANLIKLRDLFLI